MINKIKRILMGIGVIGIIFGLIWLQRSCPKRQQRAGQQDYLIEEETYRRPTINIPILVPQPPVAKKLLPIPSQTIKKTIEIEVPPSEDLTKVTLIIDKEDRIFTTKDTPKDVVIKATTWKPRLFAFDFKFGYTLAFDGHNLSHCLALDYFRIHKFYFGSDIGVAMSEQEFQLKLIGLAVRYAWMQTPHTQLLLGGGYNFMFDTPYISITVKW